MELAFEELTLKCYGRYRLKYHIILNIIID